MNLADTIQGEINRMCVTQELSEFNTMYEHAKPFYKMTTLNQICNELKRHGYKIVVIMWGSKKANQEYNAQIANAKQEWLKRYGFPYDDFYLQPYGTLKNQAINFIDGDKILVDDNKRVCKKWIGKTIDATNDILTELKKLYKED